MRKAKCLRNGTLVLLCVVAGPSLSWAGDPTRTAPLSEAAIARAVEDQLRADRTAPAQQAQSPASSRQPPKRDGIWNGLLIGAGVGGVVGALAVTAGTDDCLGEDGLGGCLWESDPDVGLAVALGAAIGAGIGALVDVLIK
jgi:uncharacterized protein YcfJ